MENRKVYYGLMEVAGMRLYVGVSERGLMFVGSDGADIGELERWAVRKKGIDLTEDQDKIAPFARELALYLSGARREFDLPLDFAGTTFQETVW